ncbi:SIR2 family protein [Xenorhabdus bovienii]|uniref:NAD(+) hydrolase ThsA n=1 Tax=Xenorhabdus bovienii str. kraussei Becker Underwood TaxID=1398204 RepID=A0A077PZ89_XENBV|nr:SIR2 family protein [Xenorhabdus bovienii]CDH26046.1 USG protein [Xenorhabdus bovienii str. kraussei Becker Underwood]
MASLNNQPIDLFIRDFVKELNENNTAIFAGAGLSVPAGYVNWKRLLTPLAEELGIDIEREHDLVSLAQYHNNANGRGKLNQQLMDEIGVSREPTINHNILARLPISTYWTTNYDKLIEKALEQAGKIPDVKYTTNQLAITKKKRDAVVYKMHGDIDHPDKAVITKDDYERYQMSFGPFINALSGDLISKTFLFLGFSFTDPNLDYVMSRIRIHFNEHQRQHYCIFKTCSRTDYDNDEDFNHAEIKQQLVINDLKRFQVKVLLIDSYDQIATILRRIEMTYRCNTIFLSGSAHVFEPWTRTKVEGFLCRLGHILIEKGYRISSGIGLGIGNALITGAIQKVYQNHGDSIADHLIMRPFPQYIKEVDERQRIWRQYRQEVIGYAGIAIFFMGNKSEGGKVVVADGCIKEFEIAHNLGLVVIPVGASGHAAQDIFESIKADYTKYYPQADAAFLEYIEQLNNTTDDPETLLSSLLAVIDFASKFQKQT